MKKAFTIVACAILVFSFAGCHLFGPTETAATPTFSPPPGTYTAAQNVTIGTATTGATIYCATDGGNPTTSSDKYTAAIAIGETTTIKAFAVMSGMIDSEITSATYTIALPSIVGEWLIDQTYQAYYDSPPTTMSLTQNFTMIMNADETFTGSGTSKWEIQSQVNVESTGTYTYDEVAGTLEIVHTTILVDGNPMDFPAATYDCEITETTMTLTYPLVTAYFPAEPLIYTRQ